MKGKKSTVAKYLKNKILSQSSSALKLIKMNINHANKNNLKTTLFTLSDIVDSHSDILKGAINSGHEIALHGTNHKRPLEMTIEEFRTDCIKGAKVIEENLSTKINGYRAACFSLDRQRLDILKNELGFLYDSSRIDFSDHPLYGSINMDGFYEKENYIYD